MAERRYDPGKRRRCVGEAWKRGRHVRILHPQFGYKGKIGHIKGAGADWVYVRVVHSKKIGDHSEVAYKPEHLKLI
jgi:hypothetical protein